MSDQAEPSSDIVLNRPVVDLPRHWLLDHEILFLNHGAFGACPRRVLEFQSTWRTRMERQPLQFLVRELEADLDAARATLADFVGANASDLVFVGNATSGVNTVLRSLNFTVGDELLVSNQEYNASRNALDFVAERSGARVIVANVPFPFRSEDELVAPILECVTPRTRLALIDHVTSQTGIVMPIARLVNELHRRGVDTLVDGAHAPGMIPLNLNQLGAAYYTGNCHKWLCGPKSAALLYVRPDRQNLIGRLPSAMVQTRLGKIVRDFNSSSVGRGTGDPTAALSVPEAIRFIGSLLPGGWPEVMAHNRALALSARKVLCEALDVSEPCPPEFIGSLAAIPLPDAPPGALPRSPFNEFPLQDVLRLKYRIEVPIISWPAPPQRLLRISAQLYNALPQYHALAKALLSELPRI